MQLQVLERNCNRRLIFVSVIISFSVVTIVSTLIEKNGKKLDIHGVKSIVKKMSLNTAIFPELIHCANLIKNDYILLSCLFLYIFTLMKHHSIYHKAFIVKRYISCISFRYVIRWISLYYIYKLVSISKYVIFLLKWKQFFSQWVA